MFCAIQMDSSVFKGFEIFYISTGKTEGIVNVESFCLRCFGYMRAEDFADSALMRDPEPLLPVA